MSPLPLAFSAPTIDFSKLAAAQQHYHAAGYLEIAVPWIVQHEAYAHTCPPGHMEFYALGGYLNASGEQSFIQLMLDGTILRKHSCVTACFRDDVIDALHQTYFIKLELIDTDVSPHNLQAMITCAKTFLDAFFPAEHPTKIIQTDAQGNAFDLVDPVYDIELGSYGIRHYKDHAWIYGTGVALPRLDIALKQTTG